MLNSCNVVAFSATGNPAKAKTFYKNKLGLRLVSEDPFALRFDANGTMLRVAIVQKVKPAPYTVLGWDVPEIRKAVQKLTKKGVVFERFEGMPQDDLGIWEAPSGSKVAWFKDPDGNILSVTEFV